MSKGPIIIALAVLILLNPSSAFLTRAYAFGPTCQYSNVVYNYPNEVIPGEQFMVSISLPAVCPQANNYHLTVRLDVENSMDRVLASNYTQDGFVPNNGKPFTFTVTNDLTAPSKPGPWRLQFIVYAFMSEDDADGLDYEVKAPQTIQVGQSTPLQMSNNTVTSTTAESSTLSPATYPAITQSTAETVGRTSTSYELYESICVVIAAVLLVALALFIRRRDNSEAPAQ